MGPCQILLLVVLCTLVCTAVVGFLSLQGVPVLVAILGVYAVAVAAMLGMQHRARQWCDSTEHPVRQT